MGGKQSKGGRWVKLDKKLEKESNSTIGDAQLTTLKLDWAAVKGENVDSVNWKKTSINLAEFKQLVDERSPEELSNLFNLYDVNRDNAISWQEFICVCALIMSGDLQQKIKLVFNSFDDDGNGTLSKEEFTGVARRFSTKVDALQAFINKVFAACDANHDGKVTLQEFLAWQQNNPKDFQEFIGPFAGLL